MSRWILQVSAGTGPREVRRFVALLADRIETELRSLGLVLLRRTQKGEAEAPRSVELELEGDAPGALAGWPGTHELVARSPSRLRNARKRWYAGLSLHPTERSAEAAVHLEAREVEIQASRAGGPGGQHVNKTSSAVRAVHRPTGVAVRVTDQRSQNANRRTALQRIAEKLEQRDKKDRSIQRGERRTAHYTLIRGAPVRRWRLAAGGESLCPIDA